MWLLPGIGGDRATVSNSGGGGSRMTLLEVLRKNKKKNFGSVAQGGQRWFHISSLKIDSHELFLMMDNVCCH